jgi:hypothetical protein
MAHIRRHNLAALPPIAAAAISLTVACAAHAQYNPNLVQPVEPGVGDIGPLGISTRLLPLDLRQPMGFERVFRVPGSSRGVGTLPSGEERFARVSGAVTAVFPRSDYVETKDGTRPAIPDGTIFYIGTPPISISPESATPSANAPIYHASNRVMTASDAGVRVGPVDLRVQSLDDTGYRELARTVRSDDPEPPRNIFTNEQFRRARLRQLLLNRAEQSP